MGEAEEDQGWPSLQALLGDDRAALIRQLKRAADRGRRRDIPPAPHDQEHQ